MQPHLLAEKYAGELAAVGIRATTNPQMVLPPCVLLSPPRQIRMDVLCGAGEAEMTAALIVSGPDNATAWQELDGLLADVLASDVLTVETVEHTYQDLDQGGAPASPSYVLTWTDPVDWN